MMIKTMYMKADGNENRENQKFWEITKNIPELKEIWKWGEDNLLPENLTNLAQNSTIHRRMLNDKADYIAGRGFTADDNMIWLKQWTECVNGKGETLRNVLQKIAFDKCLFGNAFLEVVTDVDMNFVSLFHQDASKCRIDKDNKMVVMHHDWTKFKKNEAVNVMIYPKFAKDKKGILRAMIHYKDYEPMAENYGVPKYIAAMGAATIAHKTDKWNVARLENAFQPSGVMVLDGETESEWEAIKIAEMAQKKFAGNPGQVMFMVKDNAQADATKFIPITQNADGDWKELHEQATQDIVVAHSWFRTLSGLNYSTGFSAERIMYEYNIALNTVIKVEQNEIIEPIVLLIERMKKINCDSLAFINTPPFDVKPNYMRVWEARKIDGFEYDKNDPLQNMFLAEMKTK